MAKRPLAAPSAMSPAAAVRIRAALTHPVSLWAKRRLRSAAWLARGAGVKNPPLPGIVSSALFVCLGNICRSPFAALLAERLLAEEGLAGITCGSAGIRPSQAERPPAPACSLARIYGLSLDCHVPRPLTRELVASHDLVIVMEAGQLRYLQEAFPDFRDRLFLLPLYDDGARDAYERFNIADPYGQPDAVFEVCYGRVTRALGRWVAAIKATGAAETSVRAGHSPGGRP